VELARSLLAVNSQVSLEGMNRAGETEGEFQWRVVARPVNLEENLRMPSGRLQALAVTVSWRDGGRRRSVTLDSVVAGREMTE